MPSKAHTAPVRLTCASHRHLYLTSLVLLRVENASRNPPPSAVRLTNSHSMPAASMPAAIAAAVVPRRWRVWHLQGPSKTAVSAIVG